MTDRTFTRWQYAALALFCGLLAPLWPSSAAAVTGNDWRALPAAARASYVTGVVDNLVDFGAAVRSLVPAEKRTASEKMIVSFEDCIAKTPRPPSQLVAIVEKYVKDNPAHWHARMSGLVFEALRCKDTAVAPGVKKGE
jgi:Ssp1 endopeptidase immunity protein Rap1a